MSWGRISSRGPRQRLPLSRPAVPQAGAQGNLLHHGPVLHPCLAILQVHSPGGGPLQPSKQPVALHKLRFMSLVI